MSVIQTFRKYILITDNLQWNWRNLWMERRKLQVCAGVYKWQHSECLCSSDVKLRIPPKRIQSLSHSQIITNILSARRHAGFSASLLFEYMYMDRDPSVCHSRQWCSVVLFLPNENHMCWMSLINKPEWAGRLIKLPVHTVGGTACRSGCLLHIKARIFFLLEYFIVGIKIGPNTGA